jgi:hypothetical protein
VPCIGSAISGLILPGGHMQHRLQMQGKSVCKGESIDVPIPCLIAALAPTAPCRPAGRRPMEPSPLTIYLFGPLRVTVRGEPLPRVRTRSVEWLLALLALRHGRPVSRAWLAGTLWPESDPRRPGRSAVRVGVRRGTRADAGAGDQRGAGRSGVADRPYPFRTGKSSRARSS